MESQTKISPKLNSVDILRQVRRRSMSLGCLCLTMAIRKSFLFVCNFNMTIVESGTLETGANIQYLCALVCGEALHQFDLLSSGLESTEALNVEYIIKSLASFFYFLLVWSP